MKDRDQNIQNRVHQDKLAGFIVSLGGIGCHFIKDIGGNINCPLEDDLYEYAVWDFRTNRVVGSWCQFGIAADMERFVVYGLKPLETSEEQKRRELINRQFSL